MSHLSMSRARASVLGGAALYIAVLYVTYVRAISPEWSYRGYTTLDPSALWIVSVLCVWFAAMALPVALRRPSDVIVLVLYVVALVPIGTIPGISRLAGGDALKLTILCTLAFVVLAAVRRIDLSKLPPVPIPSLSSPIFWSVIALLAVVCYSTVVIAFGFRLAPSIWGDVYTVRFQARDVEAEGAAFTGYAVMWLANVVNPLFFIFGLNRRRIALVASALVGQLYIFSVTGLKSVLLSSLLLGYAYWATRTTRPRRFGPRFIWTAVSLVVGCAAVDLLMGGDFLVSLIVRRSLVTPGLLTGFYFEFFSANPLAHLGHSVLSGLFHYPYNVAPPFVIGRAYFGDVNVRANANLWADGFANFGALGILGFTGILALVLVALDKVAEHRSRFAHLMFVLPAVSLADTALLTTLLTHGLLLSMFVVALAPSDLFSKHDARRTSRRGQSARPGDPLARTGSRSRSSV